MFHPQQPWQIIRTLHSRHTGGQCCLWIQQQQQQYVIKYLTEYADNTTAAIFRQELQHYQQLQTYSFCLPVDILPDNTLLPPMDNTAVLSFLSPISPILILPYATILNLEHSSLNSNQSINLFIKICRQVLQLHHIGWVHGDLKPQHIAQYHHQIKLLDFGLSHRQQQPYSPYSATPAYMAPELFTQKYSSVQSDIYALGIIFFQLLMNQKPYQARQYKQYALLHCQQEIPLLNHNVKIFQPILDRMLAKQRHHRYSSVQDVLADLIAVTAEFKPFVT